MSDAFDECCVSYHPIDTGILVPEDELADTYGRGGRRSSQLALVPVQCLQIGQSVVGYRRGGALKVFGPSITDIRHEHFSGELVTIETENGLRTRCTPSHHCVVEIGSSLAEKHVVYLMKKGVLFRIGVAAGIAAPGRQGLGAYRRMQNEGADASWILSVHNSRCDALASEVYTSWLFGIPQVRFRESGKYIHRNQHVLDWFWSHVGDLTDRATECLEYHKRHIGYPLCVAGKKGVRNNHLASRLTMVHACNLIDGMKMLDCNSLISKSKRRRTGTNELVSIRVGREAYSGEVYAIQTDNARYVADGILTKHCWQSARSSKQVVFS